MHHRIIPTNLIWERIGQPRADSSVGTLPRHTASNQRTSTGPYRSWAALLAIPNPSILILVWSSLFFRIWTFEFVCGQDGTNWQKKKKIRVWSIWMVWSSLFWSRNRKNRNRKRIIFYFGWQTKHDTWKFIFPFCHFYSEFPAVFWNFLIHL